MRNIVLLFFCIIVSFGLASCSWTKVYNDLEEDHIAGKHFLDGFYGAVKNKDLGLTVGTSSHVDEQGNDIEETHTYPEESFVKQLVIRKLLENQPKT